MILPVVQQKSATVFPLLDCNARCPFCSTRIYTEDGIQSPIDHREGRRRRAKDYTMPLEDLKRSYDALKADGVTHVNLQGGEPTMYEELPQLIEYGHAIGLAEQVVVSNGRRFKDEAFTQRLLAARPKTIVLSIFGADANVHDAALGVRGAFDDVVAGVKHLVRQAPPGARAATSVMAQFTLYSGNFRELPAMLRFWHGLGLRDFTVRLLRETDNTKSGPGPGGSWFFDLAALKPHLLETLDFAAGHRDVFLTFSEVFYCLLDDAHLAYVLGDLASNPNLRGAKVQLTKHFDRPLDDRTRKTGGEACTTCDLAESCIKPEDQYRDLLTAPLRPWHVASVFERLLRDPVAPGAAPLLYRLVEKSDRLEWFGVAPAARTDLLAKAVAHAAAHDPMHLTELLFRERSRVELRQVMTRFGTPPQVRLLRVSDLGGRGPLPDDVEALLGRLADAVPEPFAAQVAFLRKCTNVSTDPLVASFAWTSRTPQGPVPGVALVFDDVRIGGETLRAAVEELTRGPQ